MYLVQKCKCGNRFTIRTELELTEIHGYRAHNFQVHAITATGNVAVVPVEIRAPGNCPFCNVFCDAVSVRYGIAVPVKRAEKLIVHIHRFASLVAVDGEKVYSYYACSLGIAEFLNGRHRLSPKLNGKGNLTIGNRELKPLVSYHTSDRFYSSDLTMLLDMEM